MALEAKSIVRVRGTAQPLSLTWLRGTPYIVFGCLSLKRILRPNGIRLNSCLMDVFDI